MICCFLKSNHFLTEVLHPSRHLERKADQIRFGQFSHGLRAVRQHQRHLVTGSVRRTPSAQEVAQVSVRRVLEDDVDGA